MSLDIEALPWTHELVDALPGDPREDLAPRQVRGALYSRVQPTPVSAPRLLALVPEVADLVGLAHAPTPALVEVLSGNRVLPAMRPYAACYGGHQFGAWAGQLGDGRALTLGEVRGADGAPWELQLKGAGPTPYSRRADGRAVLRSSLRELVCSEAMHHLGVPTTRALSLVTTGDGVVRDLLYDGHPEVEPGAIVCRVAPSFVRFGNFELPASRGEHALLEQLTRWVLTRHYPHLVDGPRLDVPGFLAEVCRRTALMVNHWMRVGFVHGVMNTDNMSILGLTIDYGPYGWLEPFDPSWTPNTTDAQTRRYRFGQQPRVALWNLTMLAQALVPLVDDPASLEGALDAYADTLGPAQLEMALAKLGLVPDAARADDDAALATSLYTLLGEVPIDMTLYYRRLAELPLSPLPAPAACMEALSEAYYAPEVVPAAHVEHLHAWLSRYAARAADAQLAEAERHARMSRTNPLYVPRNALVHTVIEQAAAGDVAPLTRLLEVLRRPYEPRPGLEAYAAKRPAWAEHKPGCSMLSCSS
jgi:uncharacterized protein YdiU (UPF0061 family)